MTEFLKVARLDEIPSGSSKLVQIEDIRIAVFNLNGEYYAVEDVCTHDGGPLVEGQVVDGTEVECPRHGARFDIRSGKVTRLPAFGPVETFEVKIEGNDVLVESPV